MHSRKKDIQVAEGLTHLIETYRELGLSKAVEILEVYLGKTINGRRHLNRIFKELDLAEKIQEEKEPDLSIIKKKIIPYFQDDK